MKHLMAVTMPEISNGPNLSGEKQVFSQEGLIALKKLEYDYSIGRLGLQGTLWGAWAALVAIILIVFAPIFTGKDTIEGWQIVGIVGLIAVASVAYGAYVFNRALKISAEVQGVDVKVEIPTGKSKAVIRDGDDNP